MKRVVLTCLAALLLPLGVVATPVHAASLTPAAPSGYELTTSLVKVMSSTGRKLDVQLLLDRYTSDDNSAFFAVSLSDAAGESHEWSLQVPDRTLTYSGSTRKGSLSVGHKMIAPLGSVSLSISSHGTATSHTCSDGDSYTRQPVTLTGTFSFHTQSKAWGKVSRGDITFATTSSIQTDFGHHFSCFDPANSQCDGTVSWNGPVSSSTFLFGWVGKHKGKWISEIAFDQTRSLSKPLDASRDDFADVVLDKHPRLRTGAGGRVKLTISGSKRGLVTGSATLTSTGPEQTKSDLCTGGTAKTWSATYVNGPKPLTAHLQFGGTLSPKDGRSDFVKDSNPAQQTQSR